MSMILPLRTIVIVVLLFAAACSKQKNISHQPTPQSLPSGKIIFPQIVLDDSESGSLKITHKFRFEGKAYKLRFDIDEGAYEGAKTARKTVIVASDAKGTDWTAGYQDALIDDPAQDGFYDSLFQSIRTIRDKEQLDRDRYAELITIFVQSITYCSEKDQAPKFPIETFVDKCGDCDDKSRLLAALLSKEGYDTALFIFHDEKHMATGIKSDDDGFRSTGYTYIETTSPSYIGFPSYEYSEVKLNSTPDVYPIGKGKERYKSAHQVAFLHKTLTKQRDKALALKEKLDEVKPRGEMLKADYEKLKEQLESGENSLPVAKYNKLVEQANRAGKKFNRAVKEHNALIQKLNLAADITVYVMEHPDDRKGVYAWVKEKLR